MREKIKSKIKHNRVGYAKCPHFAFKTNQKTPNNQNSNLFSLKKCPRAKTTTSLPSWKHQEQKQGQDFFLGVSKRLESAKIVSWKLQEQNSDPF